MENHLLTGKTVVITGGTGGIGRPMSEAVLDQRSASALAKELTRSFSGDVLTAGEPGQDESRTIWNAMVDKRPAFIARCATSRDVTGSVNPVAVASATLSVQP